jgi:hypothetical protein
MEKKYSDIYPYEIRDEEIIWARENLCFMGTGNYIALRFVICSENLRLKYC